VALGQAVAAAVLADGADLLDGVRTARGGPA
jgi:hypothetical protein